MKIKTPLMIAAILLSPMAHGHGEDKPGPHRGIIRMPGMFHTEVVKVGPEQVRVYLLDMNWKNPTVRDSELDVEFDSVKTVSAKCESQAESFLCAFDRQVNLNNEGKLLVRASRENQLGVVVEYPTPFKHKE